MKFSYTLILLLVLLPVIIFFQTRGVVIHDEGYILHSAQKILNGYLPYRDFHFVYSPLSIFATAFSFKILGSSILSSRILMVFINILSAYLIYKIVHFSTKNKIYATVATLLFVAWGPTHINFSWPVMYAILTALATCFALMKFLETRKIQYLFIAGLLTFLVFAAKQNFGVIMALPVVSFFAVKHARSLKFILPYLYGFMWGFIFFLYLPSLN